MNGLVTVTDNNRSVIDNDPLVVQRAARLLREVVERDWTEKSKPIALLRALCQLEARSRGAGQQGGDGKEIASAMAELGDKEARVWLENNDEDAFKAVRRHWKTLEGQVWPTRHGPDSILQQRAREQGLAAYPEPAEFGGGGHGNRNLYGLALRALTPSQKTEVPTAVGRWIRLLEDGVASAPLYWQPIARLGDNCP